MKRFVPAAIVALFAIAICLLAVPEASAQVCDGPICQMMQKPAQLMQKAVQAPSRVVERVRPDDRPLSRIFSRVFHRRQNARCEVIHEIPLPLQVMAIAPAQDLPSVLVGPITIASQTLAPQDDDLRSFRRKANEMADRALEAGEISRWERVGIRTGLILPRVARQAKQALEAELALQDPNYQGWIDWENFDVEKFRQVVEILMELLKAFGVF